MARLTPKDWKDPDNLMWKKLSWIKMRDEPFRAAISEALQKLARHEDLEDQGQLIEGKPVDFGYVADWYISSVMDDEEPVWTDKHIEELLHDFILIPKGEDN